MKANRVVRVILGLLCLAIFLGYAFLLGAVSPKSEDFTGGDWATYLRENYGLNPDGTPVNPTPEPVAEAAPAVVEPAPAEAPVDAAPAQTAATPEPTVDPSSPYGQALANAAARGLPTPPDIDISQWQYVLVNGEHPLNPIDYAPANLVYLNMTGDDTEIRTGYDGNRQVVDAMIAQPLIDMTQACKAAGLPIYLSSSYRSYSDQAANFQRVCQNNGISDGKNSEGNYITMPAGHSEHQTALCCDITDYYHEIKNDAIAQIETVQWLGAHCADYGFVLRFPQDKRDITHVMGESWHFRYVGVEAARYMTDNNLCLEEFVALYGVL
ncbi:MAG: D-alanyl-D-alanine carboxypeptidase family protein [Eubacteriales bacterium]|nr:D-alanyl-D-alanine carboxypeptidase family protein [Eubacteriales bacterium]